MAHSCDVCSFSVGEEDEVSIKEVVYMIAKAVGFEGKIHVSFHCSPVCVFATDGIKTVFPPILITGNVHLTHKREENVRIKTNKLSDKPSLEFYMKVPTVDWASL